MSSEPITLLGRPFQPARGARVVPNDLADLRWPGRGRRTRIVPPRARAGEARHLGPTEDLAARCRVHPHRTHPTGCGIGARGRKWIVTCWDCLRSVRRMEPPTSPRTRRRPGGRPGPTARRRAPDRCAPEGRAHRRVLLGAAPGSTSALDEIVEVAIPGHQRARRDHPAADRDGVYWATTASPLLAHRGPAPFGCSKRRPAALLPGRRHREDVVGSSRPSRPT